MLLDLLYLAVGTGLLVAVLVVRQGVRSPVGSPWTTSLPASRTVFLFVYLIYALLRPERF